MEEKERNIAVVIPCYRVKAHILAVLKMIGSEVTSIFIVDDACPDGSGDYVAMHCEDPRVTILRHTENRGIGGAMITGYMAALDRGADMIVKIDGDGQMSPHLIPHFVRPIVTGVADYTKGNRFYSIEMLKAMPIQRIIGNVILSFLSKFSTGYWNIFDPTNGYTVIHAKVLRLLPLHKISTGYFFETDMLFHLNIIRAVVWDVPMQAVYGTETSHLNIRRIIGEFLKKHVVNFIKRIGYNYFLRDFSICSLQLIIGLIGILFGVSFGSEKWMQSTLTGMAATTGTVMLAVLPFTLGLQFLLAVLAYDISSQPRAPIHPLLP